MHFFSLPYTLGRYSRSPHESYFMKICSKYYRQSVPSCSSSLTVIEYVHYYSYLFSELPSCPSPGQVFFYHKNFCC
jgi:hypothetical protein